MRKAIIFATLLSFVILTGCEKNQNEEISKNEGRQKNSEIYNSSSKNTSLSSEIEKQSQDSFVSPIENPTNKQIVDGFINAGLFLYNPIGEGPHEITENDAIGTVPVLSGINFYTKPGESKFEYIINVQSYSSSDEMNQAYNEIPNLPDSISSYYISKNEAINSIIFASTLMEENTYELYKSAFESVQ